MQDAEARARANTATSVAMITGDFATYWEVVHDNRPQRFETEQGAWLVANVYLNDDYIMFRRMP